MSKARAKNTVKVVRQSARSPSPGSMVIAENAVRVARKTSILRAGRYTSWRVYDNSPKFQNKEFASTEALKRLIWLWDYER